MARGRKSRANHPALKARQELVVAWALVRYLRELGCAIGDPRPGDPQSREPDAVCDSPFGPLGIEVASGNYDAVAGAKAAWDATRSGAELVKITLTQNVLDPNLELAESWQRTMEKHLENEYSVLSYLVLDGTLAGYSRLEDLPQIFKHMRIPPRGRFAAIFAAMLIDTDKGLDIGIHQLAGWQSHSDK